MPTKREIIRYFMGTSKGIKATASYFGISKTYVGCVVTEYKKKKILDKFHIYFLYNICLFFR